MFFDEMASKWDTERRIERAKVLANSIECSLGETKGLTALEIGCGTGLISFDLINKFCKIYCVDSSKEMLSVINEKISQFGTKNIFAFGTELLSEHKYYGKFDVVYSSMVFHHIVDIERELSMLHNLLKEDGNLIIIDLDKEDGRFHKGEKDFCEHNGFDRLELQKVIINSGFQDVKFQTIYVGEKKIVSDVVKYSLFLCCASCK
jgi:ubiquinone/menaquinone biosynthesis C-methylase UbiE